MPTCGACRSTDVRVRAKRRRTGSRILQCRVCGLRALDMDVTLDQTSIGYDNDDDITEEWTSIKRESVASDTWPSTLDELTTMTSGREIFDVGAHDGSFLDVARKAGFHPSGNELASGAIRIAKSRYDIDLTKGDLSRIPDPGKKDAVTMWCVLAHVPDDDQLLLDARRLLRPGGVLFMQTPRWTTMDSAALLALELTGGRESRIVDRRTPGHHLRFHTTKSIRAQLERLGYEIVRIEPRARYSLVTDHYLSSIGLGPRIVKLLTRPLNALLSREIFFRIVVDVYARKREDSVESDPGRAA